MCRTIGHCGFTVDYMTIVTEVLKRACLKIDRFYETMPLTQTELSRKVECVQNPAHLFTIGLRNGKPVAPKASKTDVT